MKKAILSILALVVPAIFVIITINMVDKTWFTGVSIICFVLMALQTIARMNQSDLKDSYLFALSFRWNALLTFSVCAFASWPCANNTGDGVLFFAMGGVYFIVAHTICLWVFPETEKLLKSYEKEEKKND